MKSLLAALILIVSAHAFASGELVTDFHYLGETGRLKLSPYLGIRQTTVLGSFAFVGDIGGGYIDQGSELNGTYARLAGDILYKLESGWSFGVGAGIESAPCVYKSFDDYAHVSASYKLW